MDGERSNIFDCFNGDNLTYTDLQPVQTDPTSENYHHVAEYPHPGSYDDVPPVNLPNEASDDLRFPELLNHANDGDGIDYSHLEQLNWIPDNDITDDEDEVRSSDESSEYEDFLDILQGSDADPEPEEEEEEEEGEEFLEDPSDQNSLPLPPSSNILVSKNGSVVWSKIPIPQVGRTPTRNVYRAPASQTRNHKAVNYVATAFALIFTEIVICILVKMTNLEGLRQKGPQWQPVDFIEMRALIGLFIHLGARKLSLLKVSKIWRGASADPVAMCTMSMTRFIQLCTALRFDDKEQRSRRQDRDVFAPLRHLFNTINNNLQRAYIPSQNLTVDEQLVPWRGRCKFLQFLPSKPDKYGIKLFLICDSKTAYPLMGIPYLGKHGERKTNLGREIVKELAIPYFKTGRNITCDNFFTDLELARFLSKKGISVLGTVRKNKAFLPTEFQSGKGITKFASKFLFTQEESLVAYKSNDKKHVIILSTVHPAEDVDSDDRKKKPIMVQDYNKTKGGVDTFDYMCHSYSCKRKTRRWPMVLFYNLLDTAVVASHVIYKDVFPADLPTHKDRGYFNELLAKDLLTEHLQRRMALAKTHRRVNLSFEILKLEWNLVIEVQASAKGGQKRKRDQGRCSVCPRKRDRKVKQSCSKCNTLICTEHSKLICSVCVSL